MNHSDMNDNELKDLLAQQPPTPDADTKARHMAAAMAAFEAAHSIDKKAIDKKAIDKKALDKQAIDNSAEKKSNIVQGFFQRLRLTRDTNTHGKNPMNTRQHSAQHPFWQKPSVISAVAASCLAVVAGVVFMQQPTGSLSMEFAEPVAMQAPSIQAPETAPSTYKFDLNESPIEEVIVHSPTTVANPEMAAKAKRQAAAEYAVQSQARAQVERHTFAAMKTEAAADMRPPVQQEFRDRFENVTENSVVATRDNPVSTFSIDVDTASYSYVRRMLNNGQLPAKDAVRSEEMINYFDYSYPLPKYRKKPFATYTAVVDSPWTPGNKLIHIGIQGYQLAASEIPQSNLVFLLDVSGSMEAPDKLPLVKQSMSLLLDTLKPDDTISIVVYAGAAGTVLEPTKVKDKTKILAALNNLQAGGGTAGAEGIALAYQLAEANFNARGVNRIILATDGDFNVGQTGDEALEDFVERKREKGIYLSVLGFGQGNYQDALMQSLAQNGNGTAAYIDTLSEAQKVLVTEATANLFPIAKDVKIQVEFNPAMVKEYRLIGYETRALKREDFNNDKVDAGEVGAGQSVTAIYEITPTDADSGLLDESRYQTTAQPKTNTQDEYAFLRLRYKLPSSNKSELIEQPIEQAAELKRAHQREANFAIAVAGFAQLLKGSNYAGDFTYDKVIELAQANKGKDEYGYRTEFVQLVRKAKIAKEM
ncbi:VWA domain-containing protein [Cellvibrio sp. NN19]|uniref:vWA domain-containing protein n=1 Tax=Cellvibrio chitinivorans TaxID=3102792 RepID=UPI002B4047AA|nr:VWA domain-containing protein [Cellvibrio sp. NN19]